ncbi:GAF domain-containing protein [bacterium CPR1]|nr:GAF domain-containing protein [bacterium CPR1]
MTLPTGQMLVGYADGSTCGPSLSLDLAVMTRMMSWLTSDDPDRGLDQALETLRLVLDAQAAELFLASPLDGEMVLSAHSGWRPSAFYEKCRFAPGEGFPGLVAARQRELLTNRLQEDPRFLRESIKRCGIRTYACTPLVGEGRLLGSVNLAWSSPEVPLPRVSELLQWAALFISNGLKASYDRARLQVARAGPFHKGKLDLLAAFLREQSRADGLQFGGGEPDCPARLTKRVVLVESAGPGLPTPCRACSSSATGDRMCLPVADQIAQCLYTRSPQPMTRFLVPSLEIVQEIRRNWSTRPCCCSEPDPRQPEQPKVVPEWSIRCFGPLEIRRRGRLIPREAFTRQKAITLLRLLLLQAGRPIGREALCEIFWPGASLQAGTNRLHGILHSLRQVLEAGPPWQHICHEGDGYCFRSSPGIFVDLLEFERQFREGKKALMGQEPMRALPHFEQACEVYRGDLFEDEPYAEWCWSEREQCRERFHSMLKAMAEICLERGELDRSEGHYRRALGADPLREDLHRGLILCLWRQGRRSEAFRQYDECARLVRQELDADPLPDTQQLLRAIRSADPALILCNGTA